MHLFFNNMDKAKINFIRNLCISHILLEKKKKKHMLFLLTKLKNNNNNNNNKILQTQYGEKFNPSKACSIVAFNFEPNHSSIYTFSMKAMLGFRSGLQHLLGQVLREGYWAGINHWACTGSGYMTGPCSPQ